MADVMFKLCFYVPAENLQVVKDAVFEAGAGRIGKYDRCCWQVSGHGQFRPLDGSQPHLGEKNSVHSEEEFRVEMVCADDCIQAAVDALVDAHPYEEVAYDVMQVVDIKPG